MNFSVKSKYFGDELTKARLRVDISQVDLAKKLKIRSQFISNWERGLSAPSNRIFRKLCNILKIDKNEAQKLIASEINAEFNNLWNKSKSRN